MSAADDGKARPPLPDLDRPALDAFRYARSRSTVADHVRRALWPPDKPKSA